MRANIDITHFFCLVARFQQDPKDTHVVVVKTIFRYLKGTTDYGLWYPIRSIFTLIPYTDVDWAGCVDDGKSTSGGAFFLGPWLVGQSSKKQDSLSLSTIEAKYIVGATSCTQLLWMNQTLKDIGILFDEPISIFCDNTSAINISKNRELHSRMT